MSGNIIIAIDGASGVGKGTLSKRLAVHYKFPTLDTGSLYRGVTLYISNHFNIETISTWEIIKISEQISSSGEISAWSVRPDIRGPVISRHVPTVSSIPEVRQILHKYQTDFGNNPPGQAHGAVLEGRDIGTNIFPNATAKIYLTASPEIKARRRFDEYVAAGEKPEFDVILADMIKRDRQDSERSQAAGKLQAAPDALIINTDNLTADEVFSRARGYIDGMMTQ